MLGSMSPAARVLSTSHCHHFAAVGDLLVYYWHGEVTLKSVIASKSALVETHRANPAGVRVLALVEVGTTIPPAEVRTASSAIVRECASLIRGHATVLPGQGFWVAAARSVVAATFFIAPTPYSRKVFELPEPALAWLSTMGKDQRVPALAHLRALRDEHLPASLPTGTDTQHS